MASTESRANVKRVRQVVKPLYDYWASYNDIRKDGTRRLKFRKNGHRLAPSEYDKLVVDIKQRLVDNGVDFLSVYYGISFAFWGSYLYLVVVVPE